MLEVRSYNKVESFGYRMQVSPGALRRWNKINCVREVCLFAFPSFAPRDGAVRAGIVSHIGDQMHRALTERLGVDRRSLQRRSTVLQWEHPRESVAERACEIRIAPRDRIHIAAVSSDL